MSEELLEELEKIGSVTWRTLCVTPDGRQRWFESSAGNGLRLGIVALGGIRGRPKVLERPQD